MFVVPMRPRDAQALVGLYGDRRPLPKPARAVLPEARTEADALIDLAVPQQQSRKRRLLSLGRR